MKEKKGKVLERGEALSLIHTPPFPLSRGRRTKGDRIVNFSRSKF